MISASFLKWRAKFSGMDVSMASELKAMAERKPRLKRMYTEMSMQNDLLNGWCGTRTGSSIGEAVFDYSR